MTTSVNFAIELPEELPEATSTWVGAIVAAEFAMPPERKQLAIRAGGGEVRPELHFAIQPQSFRYESDRSMFPDDLEHIWVPVFRRDGEINGKGSMLDDYSQAFRGLGYPIRNDADLTRLVGKKFRFRTFQKKLNAEGITDPWLRVPVEPADDYVAPATTPVRHRPPKRAEGQSLASLSTRAVDDTAAVNVLKRVLEGKTEAEYLNAILTSASQVGEDGAKLIMGEPFLSEAMGKAALTERMVTAGMQVIAGRLVS